MSAATLSIDERNARQSRKDLRTFARTKEGARPECAVYLSNDEKALTTWTGETLALVDSLWRRKVGFGGDRWYFRAHDAGLRKWHGNGPGPGMYVRCRRTVKS